MRRYFDADKLKEFVDKQYKYCHGYTGTKKDVYREALLAVKSAIHCQSVSEDILKAKTCKEFAEKLKEKSFKTIRNYGLTKDVVEVCGIDSLLKEMVGEIND